VKSLSMAMGIQRPGFQLLSLAPHQYWQAAKSTTTYADAPCLLPGQLEIYLSVYVPLFAISLLVVFVVNVSRVASRSSLRRWHTKRSSSPLELASRPRSGNQDDSGMTSDEDPNSPSSLPLPAPVSSRIRWTDRKLTSSWVPFDQPRLRAQVGSVIPNPLLYRLGRSRGLGKRKLKSFIVGFIRDVRDIAVFPLIVFVLISLWISFS